MIMANDQIFNNYTENKKVYFDDLSPIRECLDGCDKCLGYYIFDDLESYSICECTCRIVLLTLEDIKSEILVHQEDKYYKDCQRQNTISTNTITIFDIKDELFTKQRKEAKINVRES